MYDDSRDGLYVSPDLKRQELCEKYSKWDRAALLKLVAAYEVWMQDSYVYSFNAAFRGSYHSAYSENMRELKDNLLEYDAVCRELAKRILYETKNKSHE